MAISCIAHVAHKALTAISKFILMRDRVRLALNAFISIYLTILIKQECDFQTFPYMWQIE